MFDTDTLERVKAPQEKTVIAGNLHHAMQMVAQITPLFDILQIPLNNNNRAAISLIEPIYTIICDMLDHSIPLTQNQICDRALEYTCTSPEIAPGFAERIDTIRTLMLPVWTRMTRDGHEIKTVILQTLLHVLAWRSEYHWLQDQSQRLLWQGGVLSHDGLGALKKLDSEAKSRQFTFIGLSELLVATCFLASFPTGPLFTDEQTPSDK